MSGVRWDEPVDGVARVAMATDLESTLFVEAGAGSGKTTQLVARVVELVGQGVAPIDEIAAITFTDAAAGELRERIRGSLAARVSAPRQGLGDVDPVVLERFRMALLHLDMAPIGTIHSFAQRILTSFASELDLPLGIENWDETSYLRELRRRWNRLLDDESVFADPNRARALQILWSFGLSPDRWFDFVRAVDQRRDEIHRGVIVLPGSTEFGSYLDRYLSVHGRLREVVERAILGYRGKEGDGLFRRLFEIQQQLREQGAPRTEEEVLRRLAERFATTTVFVASNAGTKANWGDQKTEVIADLLEIDRSIMEMARTIIDDAFDVLITVAWEFVSGFESERRQRGKLNFDDLLVFALDAVSIHPNAAEFRDALRSRYPRLLLDEFQDTDPIQYHLASHIAAGRKGDTSRPDPGALFFVGDAKQSIYRFRGADPALYVSARELVKGAPSGSITTLVSNFRSDRRIVELANRVFSDVFVEVDRHLGRSRPIDQMVAVREDSLLGPAVSVIGAEPLEDLGPGQLEAYEAERVAEVIAQATDDSHPWTTMDGEAARTMLLGDIVILVPTRKSAQPIERALAERGIAFRSASVAAVFRQERVVDLLVLLEAMVDPADGAMVVGALRTPSFGCSDEALVLHRERGGRWLPIGGVSLCENEDACAVCDGLSRLEDIITRARSVVVSETVAWLIEEMSLEALTPVSPHSRDQLAALGHLQGLADDATERHVSLAEFVRELRELRESARSQIEVASTERDADAVTIMTIHASKGLEFPMVVVAGQSESALNLRNGSGVYVDESRLRVRRGQGDERYEAYQDRERLETAGEALRLGYVAYTRARDHLVVSLVRAKDRDLAQLPEMRSGTYAELLGPVVRTYRASVDAVEVEIARSSGIARRGPASIAPSLPSYDEWASQMERARGALRARRSIGVTSLGMDDGQLVTLDDRDDWMVIEGEDEPEILERFGIENARVFASDASEVGRAIHEILAEVELGEPEGLEKLIGAVSSKWRVESHGEQIRTYVHRALADPELRRLGRGTHRKEVYVALASPGGVVLEGYVDLVAVAPDGRVHIIDYKTTVNLEFGEFREASSRLGRYMVQAAAYAYLVGATTGREVSAASLMVIARDRSGWLHVNDLPRRIDEIAARHAAMRLTP
ncbi:MAG: UvrD-helicase domain-containing protein [Acidimicrobiales bacterium]